MRTGVLAVAMGVLLACAVGGQPLAPPLRIAFEDMVFPDKELGQKFKRFHAAAEKMAGPKWERVPYESRGEQKGRGIYWGEWCSFREDDASGPFNYHGPKELSCVQLGASYMRDKKDAERLRHIVGLSLHCRWKPAEFGWNAHMRYTSYNNKPDPGTDAPHEDFHIRWHYHPSPKHKTCPAAVALNLHGHAEFSAAFRSGGTLYLILVYPQALRRKDRTLDEEVLRLLASPESLRDQLVADHKRLLKEVREVIGAGGGIYRAEWERRAPDGQDPQAQPMPSGRALTEKDKAELLERAEKEIGAKIAAVTEHFRELHAAARKAFPIRECLGEGKVR